MRIALGIAVALALHTVIGWPWSIAGGIFVGWGAQSGSWWKGALVVGTDWLLLIIYNLAVAYEPVVEMHRVLAGFLGELPSWSIPLTSVLVGSVIGLCGGVLGSSLRAVWQRDEATQEETNQTSPQA